MYWSAKSDEKWRKEKKLKVFRNKRNTLYNCGSHGHEHAYKVFNEYAGGSQSYIFSQKEREMHIRNKQNSWKLYIMLIKALNANIIHHQLLFII